MGNLSEPRFKPLQLPRPDGRRVLVRECTELDFEALVAMYKSFQPKRVVQSLPPSGVPRIAHWLVQLQLKSRCLLALEGDRVVAHAILHPLSETQADLVVFVHQDYRRRGLGLAVSSLAVELARQAGLSELLLTTEVSNRAAIGLYRKLGFEISRESDGECAMRLEVSGARREERSAA